MIDLTRPQLLIPRLHKRAGFDSGNTILNDWLRNYAGQSRRRDTAATWVIADNEDRVVAYATVAMTGVDRSRAPTDLGQRSPNPVPALLLARLAVDRSVAGLGIGTALTLHVLATAVELNSKAACRAVIVNAVDETARDWWQHLGFTSFDPEDESNLDLYLLTSDIEATMRRSTR